MKKPRSDIPAPNATVALLGIAWYLEQDYPAILRLMADADKLPATFSRWQQIAEQTERRCRTEGRVVIRAVIDPATFPEWCARHDLQVDARARNAFAAEQAYLKGRN